MTAVNLGARAERSTKQKRALASVLERSEGFRSAQDLHAELRLSGENVGLTTVYNQLRALNEAGQIDAMRSEDGETLYRHCASEAHHHHLSCRSCGRTVEIEGPEVESWAERIAVKNGFTELTHTIEVVGTCSSCRKARDNRG